MGCATRTLRASRAHSLAFSTHLHHQYLCDKVLSAAVLPSAGKGHIQHFMEVGYDSRDRPDCGILYWFLPGSGVQLQPYQRVLEVDVIFLHKGLQVLQYDGSESGFWRAKRGERPVLRGLANVYAAVYHD